jgi:hypothetical protein
MPTSRADPPPDQDPPRGGKGGPPAAATGFAWRARKDGDVEVLHHGRIAATLRGREAARFVAGVAVLDPGDAQRLMARITGNYRRGNERAAAKHPRNRR